MLTYRPQPPSGSWTENRYLTISFFQASANGILATWHVIKRPARQQEKKMGKIWLVCDTAAMCEDVEEVQVDAVEDEGKEKIG